MRGSRGALGVSHGVFLPVVETDVVECVCDAGIFFFMIRRMRFRHWRASSLFICFYVSLLCFSVLGAIPRLLGWAGDYEVLPLLYGVVRTLGVRTYGRTARTHTKRGNNRLGGLLCYSASATIQTIVYQQHSRILVTWAFSV